MKHNVVMSGILYVLIPIFITLSTMLGDSILVSLSSVYRHNLVQCRTVCLKAHIHHTMCVFVIGHDCDVYENEGTMILALNFLVK